ncbi:MAG: response regulator transcription factor [Pseudomonadales bacterium]|nr:response regulator transcription factor [Pseudomonadales bacterium]NRA16749.1 response regulator transcription factor [Oceanospirillaceae bacterium]
MHSTANSHAKRRDIVLVVDDSADALSLINEVLEDANMDVLVALDGRAALTIAARIRPDIILLDALMPNMDGFSTCQALKADPQLAPIPVIFMTGLTDSVDIVRGLNAGGVDYLTKPIDSSELLARMKVHLSNAKLTNSAQSALDSTGQHLLTFSASGRLLWATPQAYALLARARADESWQQQQLAPQLRQWFSHQPPAEQQLELQQLDYPLSLKLISNQANGDILLRLMDGQRPTDEQQLQKRLNLTSRESQVLHWIAKGKTNREIAQILQMSPRTVNKHLEQVFPKLSVDNRTAAAAVALRVLVQVH